MDLGGCRATSGYRQIRSEPYELLSTIEPGSGQTTETHKRQCSSTSFTQIGEGAHTHTHKGERQEKRLNLLEESMKRRRIGEGPAAS